MKSKNAYILEENVYKGLIKMALPLMMFSLISSLYNIVDAFWVGQLGENQVGGVAVIGPIMNCALAFSTGLSVAALSLISRSIGERNSEKGNVFATHSMALSIVLGLLLGVISYVFAPILLDWMKTPAEIYEYGLIYFRVMAADYVFLFILANFQAIRQGGGDSKTPVWVNSISAILNAILDPIFIFVLNWGVFGAAVATVLSKIIVIPYAVKILMKNDAITRIDFKKYKIKFIVLKQIIFVAIPASIGQFLSAFGFVMMNKYVVSYGATAISAYGVGSKISSLAYIPSNGVGSALATFIGQNIGAGNIERIKECYRKSMHLIGGIAVIMTITGWAMAGMLVNLLVKDASTDLMSMATEYVYYSVGTVFFMGWFNSLSGSFDGSGNTKYTLIISMIRLWGLRIPMIVIFERFTTLGISGIWWSMILSNLIICIFGQIVYSKYHWLDSALG